MFPFRTVGLLAGNAVFRGQAHLTCFIGVASNSSPICLSLDTEALCLYRVRAGVSVHYGSRIRSIMLRPDNMRNPTAWSRREFPGEAGQEGLPLRKIRRGKSTIAAGRRTVHCET